MQSDDRVTRVVELLHASMEQYRAAIAGTQAQMTDYLATHRERTTGHAVLAATTLGNFAGGRVDANRFAAAFEGVRVLTAEDTLRVTRCIETLESLTEQGDSLFICNVPSGGDFIAMVDAAVANLGKAFAAALVFQVVKTQVFREAAHLPLLDGFSFDRWNRLERLVAPPLVVSVDGSDVDPASVARFLDGRAQLVLVIRGAIAPAALVGLITPGVFVMQTADAADVAKMIDARGPAIVAVVDQSAARFVHDSGAGPRLVERLRIQSTPAESPKSAIGRFSASQQREQLAQLAVLDAACRAESQADATRAMEVAGVAATAATAASASCDTDAVDTLAGWLLNQAGIAEQVAQ